MKTANSSPDSIGPKRQLSLPAGRQYHKLSGPQLPAVSHSPPDPQYTAQSTLLWDPPAPDDVWCMSVYSDSYRCALRPWPSIDSSETFAHICSQNSGVYSAQIRLFIIVYDQNLRVYDVFPLFWFTSGHVTRGSREEKLAELPS